MHLWQWEKAKPKQAAFLFALGALGYAYTGASSSAIYSLDAGTTDTASDASALAYGFASVPTSYVFAFATLGSTGYMLLGMML